MKTSLVFSFLILFYFSINAQTVVVAVDKMNVFYLGVDNPVAIGIEGVADEKLKVTTDNGKIIKKEKGRYVAYLERTGIANIIIEWDGQKVLKPFRVKQIPDPRVKYNCIELGYFNGLIADLQNFDFDAKCKVISYTCTLVVNNENPKQVKVNGSISDELNLMLSKFKKGDKVIFSDVYVKCHGDKVARLIKDEIKCSNNRQF